MGKRQEKQLDKQVDREIQVLMDKWFKSPCISKIIESDCLYRGFGRWDPQLGIELCTNNIPNQTIYNETLKHELIHAYDYCNRQFDPQDPRMMACSEIRAAKLSGDCSRWNELLRGNFKYNLETCVKRRAALSLQMRGVDTKYVDLAMDCYADHDPFHS